MITNNNKTKLCLINYFSKYKQLPSSHDILHANALKEIKNAKNDDCDFRKLEIEYKIPGTSTRTVKTIQYIENLDDIDIISWIEKFNSFSGSFKWSESIKLAYLRELIEVDLEGLKDENKDSYEVLETLLRVKYNAQDINGFQSQIQIIDQDDYYMIDQYNTAILRLA